jgi:hypothetical protein
MCPGLSYSNLYHLGYINIYTKKHLKIYIFIQKMWFIVYDVYFTESGLNFHMVSKCLILYTFAHISLRISLHYC